MDFCACRHPGMGLAPRKSPHGRILGCSSRRGWSRPSPAGIPHSDGAGVTARSPLGHFRRVLGVLRALFGRCCAPGGSGFAPRAFPGCSRAAGGAPCGWGDTRGCDRDTSRPPAAPEGCGTRRCSAVEGARAGGDVAGNRGFGMIQGPSGPSQLQPGPVDAAG